MKPLIRMNRSQIRLIRLSTAVPLLNRHTKKPVFIKSDTDTYKFTKNPATINGDSGAAVDAGTKDIHVDSGENTLNLNGGNTGVGVQSGRRKDR